eukprot:1233313-Amphidinium_carterae.1
MSRTSARLRARERAATCQTIQVVQHKMCAPLLRCKVPSDAWFPLRLRSGAAPRLSNGKYAQMVACPPASHILATVVDPMPRRAGAPPDHPIVVEGAIPEACREGVCWR